MPASLISELGFFFRPEETGVLPWTGMRNPYSTPGRPTPITGPYDS